MLYDAKNLYFKGNLHRRNIDLRGIKLKVLKLNLVFDQLFAIFLTGSAARCLLALNKLMPALPEAIR